MNASLKTSFVLIALIFFGKFTGLGKDILITYFFGLNDSTDAFFFAVYVSSLLYFALYSAISIVIVPTYQGVLDKVKDINDLFSVCLLFLCASIFLTILTYLFSKQLLSVFLDIHSSSIIERTSAYLKIMSLTFPISTIVAILNSFRSVKGKVVFLYLTPVFNNIVFCVAVLFFRDISKFEYILISTIFSWVFLLLLNIGTYGFYNFKLNRLFLNFRLNTYTLLGVPTSMLFNLLEQSLTFLPVYYATKCGKGMVSYYSLAMKIILVVFSVTTLFTTSHVLPKFSKCKSTQEIENLICSALPYLFSIATPIVLCSIFFSHEITILLFNRGQVDFSDINLISDIFSIVVILLPCLIIKDALTRAYFSQYKISVCMILNAISLCLILLLGDAFFKHYGFFGFLFCVIIVNYLSIFALGIFLNSTQTIILSFLKYAFKYASFSIIPSFANFFLKPGIWVGVPLFFFLYLIILYIFHDNTLTGLKTILKRRFNESTA